jgi:hypothetical protein
MISAVRADGIVDKAMGAVDLDRKDAQGSQVRCGQSCL